MLSAVGLVLPLPTVVSRHHGCWRAVHPLTATPEEEKQREKSRQGCWGREWETVGILTLKWFDTLGIIAGLVVGRERSHASERLIRMSPTPISWSGRSKHSTCHLSPYIPHLCSPLKGKPGNEVRRVEDKGSKTHVCMSVAGGGRVVESWPPNVTYLSCTATGPPECANAGQYMLGCERWKWGEKCLQLPRALSLESRSLTCTETARVGVMVMQRLMEISCRSQCWSDAGCPGGVLTVAVVVPQKLQLLFYQTSWSRAQMQEVLKFEGWRPSWL